MHIPVVILGAGIAGISAAAAIQDSSRRDYIVLEASEEIGGIAASFRIDGFQFDYGIHGLYSDDKPILQKLSNAISEDHDSIELSIADYWKGKWTRHPIYLNLGALPSEMASECLEDFLRNLNKDESHGKLTFEEWSLSKLGHCISTNFVFPYVRKFWTVEPGELSSDWMGARIKVPTAEEIITGAAANDAPNLHYVKTLFYPRQGGFGAYATALARDVHIELNKKAIRIDTERRRILLSDGTCMKYDCVVSSLPLPALLQIIEGVPRAILNSVTKLKATSLALISLGIRRAQVLPHHWVYIHDSNLVASRLSCPSNWAKANAPPLTSSLQAEVYFRGRVPSRKRLLGTVLKNLQSMNILRQSDEILVNDVRVKRYANVIYDFQRSRSLQAIVPFLSKRGIFVCGRYGWWDYSLIPDVITRTGKTVEDALGFLKKNVINSGT